MLIAILGRCNFGEATKSVGGKPEFYVSPHSAGWKGQGDTRGRRNSSLSTKVRWGGLIRWGIPTRPLNVITEDIQSYLEDSFARSRADPQQLGPFLLFAEATLTTLIFLS